MRKIFITIFFTLSIITSSFFSYNFFYKKTAPKSTPIYNVSTIKQQENLLPVIIIGSTIAGFTAALYIARSGIKAIVFEDHSTQNSSKHSTSETYWPDQDQISKSTLLDTMKQQIKALGATIISESLIKINTSAWPFICTLANGQTFTALSIIIATDNSLDSNVFSNNITCDTQGYMIMIGRTQQSNIPGLFAAGNIQNPKYQELIVSASEGAKAALDATRFLYSINVNPQTIASFPQQHSEKFALLIQ